MEILVRFVGALEILLCWLCTPLYCLVTSRRWKPFPPVINNIVLHSATELAHKIRTQEYTAEQVVRAFIIRCRQVNPMVNAIVEDCYVRAIDEAHTVDQMLASGRKSLEEMERETPLLGVPISVKESVGVQGMSQSVGCLPRRGAKASCDGAAVASLRRAGAIPIVVSNTPELCLCWETTNLITGCTRNPYDLHRTPGGSSGGEAALLGSAASVIGVASDIAGSIRLPAAFTGVFGHKPTPGYISLDGHFPNANDEKFEKFLVVGPVVRYAEDLMPVFKIMVGEKASLLKLDEEINLKKLRIMYMVDIAESRVAVPVEEEIGSAVTAAAHHFGSKYGCAVDKPCIEELNDVIEICASVFFGMEGIPDLLAVSTTEDPKERKGLFLESIKAVFGLSELTMQGLIFTVIHRWRGFVPASKRGHYEALHSALKKKFIEMLGDDGVLILPTHPIPAYYHGQFTMKTAGVGYTMLFNTLEMPATHVPTGLNKQGLPIGVQVVAAPHQDRLCLAVARELGDRFGGWVAPS